MNIHVCLKEIVSLVIPTELYFLLTLGHSVRRKGGLIGTEGEQGEA